MEKNKLRTYARGVGLVLLLILVGIVGLIGLGIITLTVYLAVAIISICVAIVAIILLPYYYARNFEVKSKNFKLKKVKKKEKI